MMRVKIRSVQIAILAAAVCVAPAVASAGAAFCTAYKKSGTRSDDFYVVSHNSSSFGRDAVKSARKDIRKRMTKEHFSAPHCSHSNTLRSGYMVVISIETEHSRRGKKYQYIAGFGTNQQAALDDAFKAAARRDWRWNKKKHGYKVQRQLRF